MCDLAVFLEDLEILLSANRSKNLLTIRMQTTSSGDAAVCYDEK
ncbi:unnamed protein product, partial [Allacma fusca]